MVTVELDEQAAADLLALVTACAGWGEEWLPLLGRAGDTIPALREVLPVDLCVEATHRFAEAAIEINEVRNEG